MTEALDVVTFGETMVCFAAHEPGPLEAAATFTKIVAGAESNVAVGLARLGLRVAWLSRLGDDSFGRYVRAALEAEGVDCASVPIDTTRRTGFMLKSRAPEGQDPVVEYHRRGSAASALAPADFDASRFLAASHLHVTGITPALSPSCAELVEHAMRRMRAAGRTVSFDPNLRIKLWPSREAVRRRSLVAPDLLGLRIEDRLIASLTLRRNNPRTHSEKQIHQIAASIRPALEFRMAACL